jgi:hypothetical protein
MRISLKIVSPIEAQSSDMAGIVQQEGDQDSSKVGHGAIVPSDRAANVPNFLHEIAKGDRRVLESMGKIVDLRKRPSLGLVFAMIDQLLPPVWLGIYMGVDEFVPLISQFDECPCSFLQI